MTAQERARLVAMRGVIAGLHAAGFVILFAFVVPSHYKGLGIGRVFASMRAASTTRPSWSANWPTAGSSALVQDADEGNRCLRRI